MAKKGPLGKVETFYIDHNYRQLDIAEIAQDLDRTIKSVETYITKTHTRQKPTVTAGEQMARSKGVVTMTENASSISDSRRKAKTINKNCITKIKND